MFGVLVGAQLNPAGPGLQETLRLSIVVERVDAQNVLHVVHSQDGVVVRVVQQGQEEVGARLHIVHFERETGKLDCVFDEPQLMEDGSHRYQNNVGVLLGDSVEGQVETAEGILRVRADTPVETSQC